MEIILGCGAQVRVTRNGVYYQAEEVLFGQGKEISDQICKPIADFEALVAMLCIFALTTYEKLTVLEMWEVIRDTARALKEYHELNSEYLANLEQGC
ncbi:hypothetical protein A1D24_03130 [Testudinibacter aquarius]|nr:hypothetical protein A1D24_03130 [Testudinibacter aquarius]